MSLSPLLIVSAQQALLPATWFVVLVRDDGKPRDKAAGEEMQKAHIGNIVARYEEGKFLAAGPLNDPSKHRRGIVILNVAKRKDVDACFVNDPYIQNRILRVEAHRWREPVPGFSKAPDATAIVQQRMIRLTRPPAYRGPLPKVSGGVGGWFTGERMGTILTATTDDAALRAALDASPAVRAGTAYEIVPLWMSPGVLAPSPGG